MGIHRVFNDCVSNFFRAFLAPADDVRSADGLRRARPKISASAVIGIERRSRKTSAGRWRRGRRDDARRIMARSPMRVRREVASPQRDRRYQILP